MKPIGKEPVKKVMRKRFPRLNVSDPVKKAARVFSKTSLNAIPVFRRNKFVGELHERELLSLAVDVQKIPEFEAIRSGMAFFAKRVGDLMSEHGDAISPNAKVSDAALMMMMGDDTIIPVMEKGKLVGVITRQDIVGKLVG